jgi:mono/diheme cytochrome c family protein
MMDHFKLAWRFIFLLLLFAAASPVNADPGKELFDKQCASCHTIGGGDTGGPDLKGVTSKRTTDWLVRVIVEPDRLTAEKDPVQVELAKKYGYEMPNLGTSRDEALKIVDYLKGGGGAGATEGAQPAAGQATPAETAVTPELVAQGKALFTGAKPFAKGGAPCAACHALRVPGVTGGNMASDLTDLYEGMGEQGLRGVLKSLKFPVMKKIYADRPLTEDEVTAIVVFAKDAAEQKKGETSALLPIAGFGILFCSLVGLILYKRRTR